MSKKCKNNCNTDCFKLENETYKLCIDYTTLDFNADMGYIRGNDNVVLISPNGTRYKISVDDAGNISTTAIV